MNTDRIQKLQFTLKNPILIKKKENLLYLLGRSFMHGYLLIKPQTRTNTYRKHINTDVVFFGDGLEKVEGVKTDFLKNVGKYIGTSETLEVFSEFTYGEVKYIRAKNPKIKIRIKIKRDPVDYQRVVKEPLEIENVKRSMQIVERVFKLVRKEIKKPGMTEYKLAQFIQSTGLKMGANDLSFPAIVASGANAAVPHHVPSAKKLKAGESIILDFGFKYKNYCSDFTRTVFLHHAPKKLAEAYNQTEKAYNESIELISSGTNITGNDAYQKTVKVLKEKRLDKYFIHSLGHGTGLEIHELPNLSPGSRDILKDSMVFSIEPGVYITGLGGIRIEDLVYLVDGKVKKFINVSTKLVDNVI
jgi:Xaa-Pro aminopeptidase